MAYKNRKDQLANQRKWYQNNKEKVKKKVRADKIRIRKWFMDYKNTIKCSYCKESHPACIDFHHIKGKKILEVSLMVKSCWSKKKIVEEINKCIPLCANCHRKEHFEKRVSSSV